MVPQTGTTMTAFEWKIMPFPYSAGAWCDGRAAQTIDTVSHLAYQLQDAVGLAGCLAHAAEPSECSEEDLKFALRPLAEHLHAILVLWEAWQEHGPRATK